MARSLLYLKDQVKDIDAADRGLDRDASTIQADIDQLDTPRSRQRG